MTKQILVVPFYNFTNAPKNQSVSRPTKMKKFSTPQYILFQVYWFVLRVRGWKYSFIFWYGTSQASEDLRRRNSLAAQQRLFRLLIVEGYRVILFNNNHPLQQLCSLPSFVILSRRILLSWVLPITLVQAVMFFYVYRLGARPRSSARTPSNLTVVFHDSSRSLQTNAHIVLQIMTRSLLF
jgi:hypothetical protein